MAAASSFLVWALVLALALGDVRQPAPARLRRCPADIVPDLKDAVDLTCADLFHGAQADTTTDDDCNLCMYSGLSGGSSSSLAPTCVSLPAVLYELELLDTGHVVHACAFAACPVARVLACAGRVRPLQAVYMDILRPLVPWSGDVLESAYATPPGAPPFGEFRCEDVPRTAAWQSLPEWPAAHRCGEHRLHPISFGIPREDIVACLPRKHVDFAMLVPKTKPDLPEGGIPQTYIFPLTSLGEMEYKRMYREAFFAMSPRKQGWETMRIYEILAGGAVPIVKDLNATPTGALAFLDKELLQRLSSLHGVLAGDLLIDRSVFDCALYKELAAALLRHTRHRLSTEAIAHYVLKVAGKRNSSRVLYVANCLHGDYQCYLSLHGLRGLLGAQLIDYPKLEYMYKQHVHSMQEIDRKTTCPQSLCTVLSGSLQSSSPQVVIRGEGAPVPAYGGGFSYGFRLEDLPINRSEAAIRAQIRRKEFDAVVFGSAGNIVTNDVESPRATWPLRIWRHVLRHYAPEDIIIIDGRDPAPGDQLHEGVLEMAGNGHYFLREIPTWCPRETAS